MADLGMDFDANAQEPMQPREILPAGWYQAAILESDLADTKAKQAGETQRGTILNLVWQIIGGQHDGRKVFDRVNRDNDNQAAVDIGSRQLSSICRACGRMLVRESDLLHNIICNIRLAVRPAKNGYEASNEIKEYTPATAAGAPAAPAQPAAPPQQQNRPPQQQQNLPTYQPPAGAPAANSAPAAAPPWQRR